MTRVGREKKELRRASESAPLVFFKGNTSQVWAWTYNVIY